VHRLFVFKGSPRTLVGVLSLSDVARFRSGTCRACLASRIKICPGFWNKTWTIPLQRHGDSLLLKAPHRQALPPA
jgi:hypothetical protein